MRTKVPGGDVEQASFSKQPTPLPPLEPSATSTHRDYRADWYPPGNGQESAPNERYWLHALLFLLTLISTVWTGGLMAGRMGVYAAETPWFNLGGLPVTPSFLWDGLLYGGSLLAFLTVHEFGHYFAARRHRISTTLPYYIPLPISIIGTLGAVIRIREPIPSRRKLFDVGAAGPLAGFVVALGLLLYALATLPGPEYLLTQEGHEAMRAYIQQHGSYPDGILETPPPESGIMVIVFGQTPLYWFLTQLFPNVPPMHELLHFPVLVAAWFGLFFTALNLLPVGQLDGGHVVYALFGRTWHRRLARSFVTLLLLSGSIGFMEETAPWLFTLSPWLGHGAWFVLAFILYFFLNRVFDGEHRVIAPALFGIIAGTVLAEWVGEPLTNLGWSAWFVWCLLIVFLIRVEHPPVARPEPLTPRRRVLGILCIVIFLLCFSIRPIYVL